MGDVINMVRRSDGCYMVDEEVTCEQVVARIRAGIAIFRNLAMDAKRRSIPFERFVAHVREQYPWIPEGYWCCYQSVADYCDAILNS